MPIRNVKIEKVKLNVLMDFCTYTNINLQSSIRPNYASNCHKWTASYANIRLIGVTATDHVVQDASTINSNGLHTYKLPRSNVHENIVTPWSRTQTRCHARIQIDDGGDLLAGQPELGQPVAEQQAELLQHRKCAQLGVVDNIWRC